VGRTAVVREIAVASRFSSHGDPAPNKSSVCNAACSGRNAAAIGSGRVQALQSIIVMSGVVIERSFHHGFV